MSVHPAYWIDGTEVDKAEYIRVERACGFHNTLGQPDEPATSWFQGHDPAGQVHTGRHLETITSVLHMRGTPVRGEIIVGEDEYTEAEMEARSLEDELGRFRFYPAQTQARRDAHERIRELCAGLMRELWVIVSPSDERYRMANALDDVCMRANAAVARWGSKQEQAEA